MDRVTFRRFPEGDLIALLWDNFASNGFVDSYMHIGQHSEAESGIIRRTKLADVSEQDVKYLKAELESIGYVVKVVKRRPRSAK